MKKPKLYRKLASAHQFGVTAGGWNSLHLASDHLLLRSSSGFIETYRRFYFADIEAITIRQTVRGIFWNAVWGVALFVTVLVMLSTSSPHVASGIFASLFALLLLVNILRGRTCAAQLQTRVQTRPLPLRRQRKALRVIEELAPKIRAAQEHLPTIAAPPAMPRSSTVPSLDPPALPGQEVARQTTGLQFAAVALLVVAGCVALFESWRPNSLVAYLFYLLVLANLGLGIAVLVQKRRRHLRSPVLPIAWTSVIAHGVGMPMVYLTFSMIYTVQSVRLNPARAKMFSDQMTLGAMRDLPGFDYLLIFYGVSALVLGMIAALLLLRNQLRSVETPAA